jgi:hypothetical protein
MAFLSFSASLAANTGAEQVSIANSVKSMILDDMLIFPHHFSGQYG